MELNCQPVPWYHYPPFKNFGTSTSTFCNLVLLPQGVLKFLFCLFLCLHLCICFFTLMQSSQRTTSPPSLKLEIFCVYSKQVNYYTMEPLSTNKQQNRLSGKTVVGVQLPPRQESQRTSQSSSLCFSENLKEHL